MKSNYTVFEENALDYDNWFEKHKALYQSELLALEQAIPLQKSGIEIGVGTGRFAQPLQIRHGVEPSDNMARLAEKRGISVTSGVAEELPVDNGSFDFVLMVTTVCFLSDIPKRFQKLTEY
jgi:ubiquinone/menaquinone biosynthesis C-methylase UbiE